MVHNVHSVKEPGKQEIYVILVKILFMKFQLNKIVEIVLLVAKRVIIILLVKVV